MNRIDVSYPAESLGVPAGRTRPQLVRRTRYSEFDTRPTLTAELNAKCPEFRGFYSSLRRDSEALPRITVQSEHRAYDPPLPTVNREIHETVQRLLIVLGLLIAAVGLLWPWVSKLPLRRLPGDIVVDRPGFKLFAPFTTMIVVSLVISLIVWLFRR
jgi:Protein of unknown function (DUF2905)